MTEDIKEIIQNRIEDIYQSGEYIYQAKELEEILNYITNLQNKNEELQTTANNCKQKNEKAVEKLGKYKHYTTPTEEQNSENEDIVDSAYNILKGGDEE